MKNIYMCDKNEHTFFHSYQSFGFSLRRELSLESALADKFKQVDQDTFWCEECGLRGAGQYRNFIETLPKVLILDIETFSRDGVKYKRPIDIPDELDLRKYYLPKEALARNKKAQ